tara:strand:- start:2367 stop:2783 length:417 start_codon:yes stop_codon:yes gene_type:complete
MSQIKDFDMKLAKEFGQIAQTVISRPTNILKRIKKANDKVDFSNGRFQEIAIDLESIAEDISSKNFDSMEALENMLVELLEHNVFLEKQLDTARKDTVVAFGCELVNEHESNFTGGEIQIQAICQVVYDTVTQKYRPV